MSYAHVDAEHKLAVLAFATLLREMGVDAVLDEWYADQRQDWFAWALREIRRADFVIVVASAGYCEAGDGTAPSRHRGVQSEATTLRDLLHGDRETWTRKVVPVVLPGGSIHGLPDFVQPHSATRFIIDSISKTGIEDLLRLLTRQPRHPMPPLGPVPSLPPATDRKDMAKPAPATKPRAARRKPRRSTPPEGSAVPEERVARRQPDLPELISIPGHNVRLGRAPVTMGQFALFLKDNPGWRPAEARRAGIVDGDYLRGWREPTDDTASMPVVAVGADVVHAYLHWAGERLGTRLRLPTEREWLAAARAGREGDWVGEDCRAGLVNYRSTLAKLCPVGEFPPNAGGFHDLLGQIWEICCAGGDRYVLRGGAFNTPEVRLLDHFTPPTPCRDDVGFRCAAD